MAHYCPVDVEKQEEVLALHCNFAQQEGRPCARRIQVGWLTSCSHLLCPEHAKEWFASNVECPVCRSGAVRMLKVDFRRPRRERNLAMMGFLPSQVFQAASEAFEFWAQQKMLEHDWQMEAGARLQAREDRLRSAYQERATEVERVMTMLSQKKQELTERLHDAAAHGNALQTEAAEARKKIERVKRRCAVLEAQGLQLPAKAPDDGWREATAWRAGAGGGAAGATKRGAAGNAPGPAAVPTPTPVFAGRPGGLSCGNIFDGGLGRLRGSATPAGIGGLGGKRRRIT
mmetsp:Transcript_63596/g.200980  ORF Transcript_63596/g.200980 Transcript_63596/m.200980 type:complete len:287 (-) Transcript_63596:80-940(-)